MITNPNVKTQPTAQVELNTRQRQILSFIEDYCRTKGHSPSLREIGQGVGIKSTSQTSYLLHRLVQWGYLGRTPSMWRLWVLLPQGYEAIGKEPVGNPNAILNELREENRQLRERCERLHCERNMLQDQLEGLIAQAG